MKVECLQFHNQRNASHYQFQNDFNGLVIKYTPQALGIVEAYALYLPHLQDEGVALVAISKSATTEQIGSAHKERNACFRGFSDAMRSKQNHFSDAVRKAAKTVMVIMDTYGNLATKPQDEESGLIISLIADLRTKTPNELQILGLKEWITELERLNNAFISLEATRNLEESKRTELRMKQVRVEVDACYRTIIERINALIVVNGDSAYVEFVKELNARIARANDAISQRKSRSSKSATDEAQA